jgi:hypothetical protein
LIPRLGGDSAQAATHYLAPQSTAELFLYHHNNNKIKSSIMNEIDDDIAMVVEEMEKEMQMKMQEEMQQERNERGSRREEISMPPNLPSAPTTYGPHDLPERLRGTAIMSTSDAITLTILC